PPVHGDGRDLDREARLEPDVGSAVDRVGGRLEGVAEHTVPYLGGRDARALERVFRGDGAQLDRREVLQRAAERTEAGPDAREEHDIGIGTLGLHLGGSSTYDERKNGGMEGSR